MPEGHTLFRLASSISAHFAGRVVSASSPQGRFAESAALIDGTLLETAESYGKHLFVDFEGDRQVHVHLGLYGKFAVRDGVAEDPRGQVRLRLVADGSDERPPAYGDLRGATACELMTRDQQRLLLDRLGPDPLRPGSSLRRGTFEQMWHDLVALMADGVRRGRIDTVHVPVEEALVGRVPHADTDGHPVYVYRRAGEACFVCGSTVRTEVLVGRNLFWCPRCQPVFRSRARSGAGTR